MIISQFFSTLKGGSTYKSFVLIKLKLSLIVSRKTNFFILLCSRLENLLRIEKPWLSTVSFKGNDWKISCSFSYFGSEFYWVFMKTHLH